MLIFEDGRIFQIAGTVLSDGASTIIPLSAVSIASRPSSFAGSTAGIIPPIIYVELAIVGEANAVAAMSMNDYNTIAIAQQQRETVAAPVAPSFLQGVAQGIVRRCAACGQK
jgi:hypothetical protein